MNAKRQGIYALHFKLLSKHMSLFK